MNAARAGRQVAAEQRLYWRNVSAAVFTFALPIFLLVVFGAVGRNDTIDGTPYPDFFVPGMLGMAIIVTTFAGLAITLTVRRDRGILKRVRGTPLPPATYLGSLITSIILVLVLEVLIVIGVGRLAFDVHLPRSLPGFLLLVVVGAACCSTLGLAVTRAVPNAEGSSAIVNAFYLPVLFLSGAFFPTHTLPTVVEWVTEILPMTHVIGSMRRLFEGHALGGGDLAWLAVPIVWGIAGGLIAWRTFRWEPTGG